MKQVCPKCGATYELAEFKTTVRDKDSLECNFCQETLIKWNGASFWVIKEVLKKPDKLEYDKQTKKKEELYAPLVFIL